MDRAHGERAANKKNHSNVRKCEIPKRTSSNKYHFTINNADIRVCRAFFESTLGIGKRVIYTALSKRTHGMFSCYDKRGKDAAVNKLDQETIQPVKNHIESFPRMESHYSRKDSRKEYLAHDLNINKMYELYAIKCKQENTTPVKESKYRQVFCEDYNFSFYRPKKRPAFYVCIVSEQKRQ